jgi:hypothetical protein
MRIIALKMTIALRYAYAEVEYCGVCSNVGIVSFFRIPR